MPEETLLCFRTGGTPHQAKKPSYRPSARVAQPIRQSGHGYNPIGRRRCFSRRSLGGQLTPDHAEVGQGSTRRSPDG